MTNRNDSKYEKSRLGI